MAESISTIFNRYIHAETGSDSTGDGSENNPWKTLAVAKVATLSLIQDDAAGVTWHAAATFREAALSIADAIAFNLRAWAGQAAPWVRGDTVIPPGAWTDNGDGTFSAAVASEPASVVWNWDTNINAQGHHYGHQVPDAAVDNAGEWDWDAGTLTVRPPTGAADPDTGDVYAVCRKGNGITLVAPVGCSVRGITFALFCEATAGQGIPLSIEGAVNCVQAGNTYWDCGYHSMQYAGDGATDCIVQGNTYYGLRAGGSHDVFFGELAAAVGATGCSRRGNTYHGYTLLRSDGSTPLESGQVTSALAHGGADVLDVTTIGNTFIGYESNYSGLTYVPISVQNAAEASDPFDWRTYAYKVVENTFVDCSVLTGSNTQEMAWVRNRAVQWSNLGLYSTGTATNARVIVPANRLHLFVCNEWLNNNNGTTGGKRFYTVNGHAIVLGDSVADAATSGVNRPIIQTAGAGTTLYLEGMVLIKGAVGIGIGGSGGGDYTIQNCVFVGFSTTAFGTGLGLATKAAFVAAHPDNIIHDAGQNTTDNLGLLDWALSLEPTTDGFLGTTRVGMDKHGEEGINQRAWGGYYGAYQFGVLSNVAAPDPMGTMRRLMLLTAGQV